ncbi:MAG: peptidoglycan-binding protein [Reyranellaceae bacterium]
MGRIAIGLGLALAVAVAAGPSARASDTKGNYAVRGVGSQECQTLLQELDKDREGALAVASWILGYITAVNRYEPMTFDITPVNDARALTGIVLALCQKNPKARLENVLSDMLRAMARARLRADSPLVQMKSGDAVAAVRQEVLLTMQQRLNQRGLLKAKADGAYGPQTEAALKEYQKAENLPVTGVADAATVLRLLVEQAPAPAAPAQPAPAQPAQPRR